MWRREFWFITFLLSSEIVNNVNSEFSYEAVTAVLARINVSYIDRETKKKESSTAEIGRFAEGAVGQADGVLVIGRPPGNSTSSKVLYLQGCFQKWATPSNPSEPWVALLLRGGCSDEDKVKYALNQNASAVLLFGNDPDPFIPKHTQFKGDAVVVYLLKRRGEILASLVENGTNVQITITKGQEVKFRITSINRTSVLFVSVSFIVLMVVSLAWLIFYYIQRFRYINAKDRLAKHLNNAAKKALAKIPVKTIKNGEKEIDESESCAVCIELYQVGDTLRSLPCKHEFHKGCVDPWLLEHRTCPMCKMDILKYYGYMPNETENNPTSGPRTIDLTTSGADATPTLVLGSARRSRNHTPSSARSQERRNSQLTLQVSVISHTNSVGSTDNSVERASAPNITNDISSSIPPSTHPISLESTTAIIRSVILSSNTQPAHVRYSNGSLSDIPPPTTANGHDGSVVVNMNETNQDGSHNEQSGHKMSQEGTTPHNRSPFEEEQGELVEVLTKGDTSNPSPRKPSRQNSSSVALPRSNSVDSCDNPSSEIDRLVNEIIDAERDDNSEIKSSPHISPSASLDSPQDSTANPEGAGAPTVPLQPQNNCPTLPSNIQSQLPVVDCNTHVSLPFASTTENYPPRVQSRNLYSSSITSEDFEELRRQDAARFTPEDGKRPSSHLVTISHS